MTERTILPDFPDRHILTCPNSEGFSALIKQHG